MLISIRRYECVSNAKCTRKNLTAVTRLFPLRASLRLKNVSISCFLTGSSEFYHDCQATQSKTGSHTCVDRRNYATCQLIILTFKMTNYASESTPLLGSNASKAKKEYVVAVAFTLVVLVDFAGVLTETPQTSILEDIICCRYYNSHRTEARRDCTAGPVQAELATITQLFNTFNLVPGILVSIPFGVLADSYGRRTVFALCMIGMVTQDIVAKLILWRSDIFAPRLIWPTSITRLVGGGDVVASSMIYLMIADVVPAQERANTFLFSACILVGDVVATPLGAFLMSKNPWIPYILSTVLSFVVGGIALVLIPETLNKPDSSETPQQPLSSTDNEQPASPTTAISKTLDPKRLQALLSRLRPLAKANIIAILLAFFVAALGRQSTGFLVQYIRQRFNWTYAKVRPTITMTLPD